MDFNEYLEILQENVIYYLENGVNPWQSPWKTAANGESKRPYNGMDAILLTTVAARKYDGDCRYYTFKQAKDMGSPVKKGEHGWPAILLKPRYAFMPMFDEDGNPVLDEDGKAKLERVAIPPVFQLYTVFNAKQLENPPLYDPEEYKEAEFDLMKAKQIAEQSPVAIKHDQIARAFYSSGDDSIHIPPKDSFKGDLEYWSTIFHEMAHSTGAAKRLSRDSLKYYNYRKDWRAKEELVAEIGAVMLCEKVGLRYTNSDAAAYVKSWADALKSGEIDFKEFYPAVSRAVHFITHPENREKMHEHAISLDDDCKAFISEDKRRVVFIQKGDGDYHDWTMYEADPEQNILIREIDGGQLDGSLSILSTFDAIKDERKYSLMPIDYFHILESEYLKKEEERIKTNESGSGLSEMDLQKRTAELAKYATPYYRDPSSPAYEPENEAKAREYHALLKEWQKMRYPMDHEASEKRLGDSSKNMKDGTYVLSDTETANLSNRRKKSWQR